MGPTVPLWVPVGRCGALTGPYVSLWVHMGHCGALMGPSGSQWVPMCLYGSLCVPMCSYGSLRVPMGRCGALTGLSIKDDICTSCYVRKKCFCPLNGPILMYSGRQHSALDNPVALQMCSPFPLGMSGPPWPYHLDCLKAQLSGAAENHCTWPWRFQFRKPLGCPSSYGTE